MKQIKLFLASSRELKADRDHFEIEIYRKCKSWFEKNIFLHLDIWEDLSAKMTEGGSQKEYNKYVQASDLFILLAYSKVGEFTEEEFDNALGKFKAEKKPFIFTYFKDIDSTPDESLAKFKQKLSDLGHYWSSYKDANDLWNKFNKELERLEEARFEKNEHSITQIADKIYNIHKIDKADFS